MDTKSLVCPRCGHDFLRHDGSGCKVPSCDCKISQKEYTQFLIKPTPTPSPSPSPTPTPSPSPQDGAAQIQRRMRGAHALWIFVTISLILAIALAFLTPALPDITYNGFHIFVGLPRQNVTVTSNSTTSSVTSSLNTLTPSVTNNTNTPAPSVTNNTNTPAPSVTNKPNTPAPSVTNKPNTPAAIQTGGVPIIPLFVIIWGYIGASVYVLRITTYHIGKKDFQNAYIPFHVIRLFIGPAFAIIIFFILFSGGFFGLTIDLTKVSPRYIQYVYAAIAFLTGYFVRRIIEILTNIVESIFHTTTTEVKDKEEKPT
ncbi:MAG: hypothetical protein WBL88_05925 [Nitrososphaeraceae archaeon]